VLAASASPIDIVVGGANAYVSSCPGDGGAVVSVPLEGGVPQALASGPGCPVLAFGAAGLFVGGLDGGEVASLPLDGSASTTLASGADRPIGVAVDEASVYWITSGGAVMKVPLSGGAPVELASGQTDVTGPAIDGASVYWASGGTIEKVPLDGGAVTTVTEVDEVGGLAVAGTHVYFADGYRLMMAPVGGGVATALSTAAGAPLFAVAADDASVYFTSYSTIWKVAQAGGVPAVLASNQGSPNALAVDATNLYWTDGTSWPPPLDGGGGQIMKLTPK
jgi:hypothetical protein